MSQAAVSRSSAAPWRAIVRALTITGPAERLDLLTAPFQAVSPAEEQAVLQGPVERSRSFFSLSSNAAYGPLFAVIGLLLWFTLSSLALHLGLAVTVELSIGESRSEGLVRVPESKARRAPEPVALVLR